MSSVALHLGILRTRRRLSQRQLAALAGLRPDTISALERGESTGIRFDTLARLCDVLGCEPGDLLTMEDDGHEVPVLGGPDEDDLIRRRLSEVGTRVDGPSFVAELMRVSEDASSLGQKPA
jgi:putative transcriptional regulator